MSRRFLAFYLNTSIVISLADEDDQHHEVSTKLSQRSRAVGARLLVSSPFTIELARTMDRRGIGRALKLLFTLREYNVVIETVDIEELWKLSERYRESKVLPRRLREDLLHYAAATLLKAEYLVSWDVRHFNKERALSVNLVNRRLGLTTLKVGTPQQLMGEVNP